jgi:hypothetical protein
MNLIFRDRPKEYSKNMIFVGLSLCSLNRSELEKDFQILTSRCFILLKRNVGIAKLYEQNCVKCAFIQTFIKKNWNP